MKDKFYLLSTLSLLIFASCSKQGSSGATNTSGGLTLSRTSIRLSVLTGISDTVTVQSQVPWKLSVSPADTSWLQVSATQGTSGNTIITLTTKAITTSSQTSSLTFSAASGASDPVILTLTRQVHSAGWQTAVGASNKGWANAIARTVDGEYWVAGYDYGSGGDISVNHGGSDMVVAKFDANGNKVALADLGGSANDGAYGVAATSDGGCIAVGYTKSNDVDVSSNHGGSDCWVVKFDSQGNVVWKETLGGTLDDIGNSVVAMSDGYVIVGSTFSTNGDVTLNHGSMDAWVVKLGLDGKQQWSKTYGGTADEDLNVIVATADGGYAVAGYTMSDVSANVVGYVRGKTDVWILKLDASGGITWQQRFGGSGFDAATSMIATNDEYTVAGYTYSGASGPDGDVESNAGGLDAWVIKLAVNGVKQWAQTYGTANNDGAYGLVATADGGCVLAGYTTFTPNGAGTDLWVWELNSSKKVLWQNTYGGMGANSGANGGIVSSGDGGYIIATGTNSVDGDLLGVRNPAGGRPYYTDWWIKKLQ